MPQFSYRARDKNGQLRNGTRMSASMDALNLQLINEGIFPLEIKPLVDTVPFLTKLQDWLQDNSLHHNELAIFARQLKLLHQAGVPIVTSLQQLTINTRSRKLAHALPHVIEDIEKGQSLSTAMQQHPTVFPSLIINILRIGENTGRLDQALQNIHEYLEFDTDNLKQIKTSFRYPLFVLISILLSIVTLNIFVIPSFGRFYSNMTASLPWQTRILIGTSNLFLNYGLYILGALVIASIFFLRYVHTKEGKYQFDKLMLKIPLIGGMLKRITLIRFSQSLSIMLNSGISATQALALASEIVTNSYVVAQINIARESVERGTSFVQSIANIPIFTQLEIQILAVGEKNGELSPSLKYIAEFHSEEIVFELKRISDLVSPILLAVVSGLVLVIALGVYLPIWNMVNLVHN